MKMKSELLMMKCFLIKNIAILFSIVIFMENFVIKYHRKIEIQEFDQISEGSNP